MRIEQLEFLLEIAKKKSFSSASENLHITPQSLSRSINCMEKELGFLLFERSFQGVTLTKAGETFLQTARKIVVDYHNTLAEIHQNLSQDNKTPEGELVIYANPLFHIHWLPLVLKGFCAENPNIRISVMEADPQSIYKRLQQAEKDNDAISRIGLVSMPCDSREYFTDIGRKNSIHFEALSSEPYCVYVSKNTPLSQLKEISIMEVLQNNLVLFSSDEANITPVRFLLEQFGKINVVFTASSFSLWLNAIKNAVGIGLFQDVFIHESDWEDLNGIVKIRIKEDIKAMLGYLYWGEPSEILTLFTQYLHLPK